MLSLTIFPNFYTRMFSTLNWFRMFNLAFWNSGKSVLIWTVHLSYNKCRSMLVSCWRRVAWGLQWGLQWTHCKGSKALASWSKCVVLLDSEPSRGVLWIWEHETRWFKCFSDQICRVFMIKIFLIQVTVDWSATNCSRHLRRVRFVYPLYSRTSYSVFTFNMISFASPERAISHLVHCPTGCSRSQVRREMTTLERRFIEDLISHLTHLTH